MFQETRKSPGEYYLRLFVVIILLALSYLADFTLIEQHPWIDIGWIVPITVAAILLGPIETLGFSLLALILSLGVSAETGEAVNLWTSAAVGLYGAVMAVVSAQVRRSYAQANIVRDALNDSPLAFSELGFPGYEVISHNQALEELVGTGEVEGRRLPDLLPGVAGERLARIMDQAAAGREQVNEPEFKIERHDGGTSFWNVNITPITTLGRSTPKKVTFFASNVTDAVQRASNREAALRISTAVMSNLDLEQTLAVTLESMMYIAGTNAGILFMLEDDQWIGMAGAGEYSSGFARNLRFPYEDMPSAVEAVQHKRTLSFEDASHDSLFPGSAMRRLPRESMMIIPLTTGNRSVGAVFCVQTDSRIDFSDEQVEFATVVGTQVALAIENASIYGDEYAMRKSLEAIEAISEAGLASLDMEEVLIQLVTKTQDVMQMDAAMILLADSEREYLEVRAATGAIADPLKADRIAVGQGLAGKAFKRGVPMKIDNVNDYDTESCPFAVDSGIRSVLAVPLKLDGVTAGVLQIGSARAGAFSAREWSLIQVLADRASHAVQNSMQHEQTKLELARAALLRDVAAACAGSRDLEKVSRLSLESVCEQLGCQIASIYSFDRDEGQLNLLASIGHPEELEKEIATINLDEDTFLIRAVMQGVAITHTNQPTTGASEAELAILRSLGSLDARRAALPIIYRGEAVGGMALTMPGHQPFSANELETFRSITDQLAVAFHGSLLSRQGGNLAPPARDLS